MFIMLPLCMLLCVITSFCADNAQPVADDDDSSWCHLQGDSQAIAILKTHDERCLIVYNTVDEDTRFTDLLVRLVMSNGVQSEAIATHSIEERSDMNSQTLELTVDIPYCLNLLKQTTKICLWGRNGTYSKGTMDCKAWDFEDIRKDSPKIPKEAWLKSLDQ